MSLINLPDELWLQICSYRDILTASDLYHATICCRRLKPAALTQLYSSICLTCRDYNDISSALVRLILTLDIHPERTLWVKSVTLVWVTTETRIRRRVQQLLQKLPALYEVDLVEEGLWNNYNNSRRNHVPRLSCHLHENPSKYLTQCASIATLRRVRIGVYKVSVQNISDVFWLPNIEHLSILGWNSSMYDQSPVELSYIDSKYSSSLKCLQFLNCSPPAGLLADSLLRVHPNLKKLAWVIDEDLKSSPLRVEDMSRSLVPLKSSLTELHLNVGQTRRMSIGMKMDFRSFLCLKILTIHDQYLLEAPPILPLSSDCFLTDLDLGDRLPASLEALNLLFIKGNRWMCRLPETVIDYRWIIALANYKDGHLQKLAYLRILEQAVGSRHIGEAEPPLEGIEWDNPEHVTSAFTVAGISLTIRTVTDDDK